MDDEAPDVMQKLSWVVEVVMTSTPKQLRRIPDVYEEAQENLTLIPKDNDLVRPRIITCL